MEVIELECLIIGAGVAGLAVARELSNYIDEIAVIEKNQSFGEETSSRNSEVIHAGIYYNKGSLKHNLIKEGREMLYDYLQNRNLPFLKSGKIALL